jgi:hypothetical protein
MANAKPVAEIFKALRGTWKLKRSLNSALPGFPSGIFEGTATFTPRKPTIHNAKAELLYAEQGQLKTDTGLTLEANRKYVYRYNADEDKISAWFVKEETKQDEGAEEADYLFHDLEIEYSKNGWTGRGDHLCNLDMYWAYVGIGVFRCLRQLLTLLPFIFSYYEFRLPEDEDEEMDVFGVRYKVKGPEKDYTSDTAYQRSE